MNSRSISGGDLLKHAVMKHAVPHDEIFVKPKKVEADKTNVSSFGRAKPKGQAISQVETERELVVMTSDEEKVAPKELVVQFSNPKWSHEKANFTDVVTATVDVAYPAGHVKHFEIYFKIFAIWPNGRREKIGGESCRENKEKASIQFRLNTINNPDNTPVSEIKYIFSAEATEAKSIQSKPLDVTPLLLDISIVIEDAKSFTHYADSLILKERNGSIHSRLSSKDAKDENGTLVFEFKKLNPDMHFDLEIQDSKGNLIEKIFTKKWQLDWKNLAEKAK